MLRLGIDPGKLYRATFICQDGLCCCNMALISFRLFRKNLGNLKDFFGQMVYRPPWQKISRTPMTPTNKLENPKQAVSKKTKSKFMQRNNLALNPVRPRCSGYLGTNSKDMMAVTFPAAPPGPLKWRSEKLYDSLRPFMIH